MKEILIIFLALCLLCSCALADTIITNESTNQTAETLVSYTIEACKEYTVTIPASITIGKDQTATLSVSLDATKYELNPGNGQVSFIVFFEDAKNGMHYDDTMTRFLYSLKNGTDEMDYVILDEDYKYIHPHHDIIHEVYSPYPAVSGAVSDTPKSIDLTLIAYPTGEESPGNYTDTLTFSVELFEDD